MYGEAISKIEGRDNTGTALDHGFEEIVLV